MKFAAIALVAYAGVAVATSRQNESESTFCRSCDGDALREDKDALQRQRSDWDQGYAKQTPIAFMAAEDEEDGDSEEDVVLLGRHHNKKPIKLAAVIEDEVPIGFYEAQARRAVNQEEDAVLLGRRPPAPRPFPIYRGGLRDDAENDQMLIEALQKRRPVPNPRPPIYKGGLAEVFGNEEAYVDEKVLLRRAADWEQEPELADVAKARRIEKVLGRRCPGKCLRLAEKFIEAKYRLEDCLNDKHCHHRLYEEEEENGARRLAEAPALLPKELCHGKYYHGYAAPFNTRGAKWGSCGPTTPFADYDNLVVSLPARLMGQVNNNPNDDILCRKPFYVEVFNENNRRWVRAKVAGACYECKGNNIQLSEKAYKVLGGHYGTVDRTPIKWRFSIDK